MDEFIDELFLKEAVYEVTLPVIPKRYILEQNNDIEPRVSLLDAELMLDDYEIKEESNETIDANTSQKKDFFADSDDEKPIEDERKKDETQGVNAKRWDKADFNKEECFNRDRNFEKFDKKHRNKSRSRDRKKHSKRSRSRSTSKRRERKDRDGKKDREEKKEKYGKREEKVDKKEEKVLDENSVEYWNSLRAKLGLSLIPESK
jgi:pre-mRNA-splicing factor 38A